LTHNAAQGFNGFPVPDGQSGGPPALFMSFTHSSHVFLLSAHRSLTEVNGGAASSP